MENIAMTAAVGDVPNTLAQPLTYGCRVLLYRASQSGYVIATDSSQSPVGLQLEAASPTAHSSIRYEHAIFTIRADDSSNGTAAGNRRIGDPLKYGHTVRLVHHMHQLPLSHHLETHASAKRSNLRVGLDRNTHTPPTRCERWRVMPRYRLRVEGELVADGDPVVLQSTATDRYLNVAEELDEESDDQCLEVSCGRLIQGFQLQLYDGDVGDAYRETTLRCGDCVTLLHTEEHKYLMADLERSVCYLRSPESRLGNISQDSNASFSKRSTVMEQAGRREVTGSRQRRAGEELNYLAVFVVEAADRRTGGALRPRGRGCYRLKGLSSGLYLCTGTEAASSVSSSESDESGYDVNLGADDLSTAPSMTAMPDRKGPAGARASYAVVLTSDVTHPGTLFRIMSAASSGGSAVLQNGGQVFLEAPSTPQGVLWVVAGAPIEDAETAAAVTVASLSQHTTTGGSVSLCARRMKSMRDGMEVRRLTAKACEELHLIRGLLPPLERYTADMPRGVGDPHRVREIRANMRHLQQLCYTRVTSSPWNGNQGAPLDGDLSPEWQSKLFHQGVAELALQVARATLECPYVSVEKLSSSDMVLAPAEKTAFVPMRYADLGGLVDMCFDFVAVLVQERPRYAQSLNSHADFVMECCRHSASALRCVCALYCNNAMFVELPMARHRLNFFLDLLSERSRDPMLLRVLQLFAMCGEEAMPEAQRVILAYLSDAGTAERVLCPTRLMQPPPSLHSLMSPSSNSVSVPGTATVAGASSSTVVNPLVSPSRSPQKKGRGRVTMQLPTCLADGTMVMVAIPHAIFATDAVPDGETTSVGTSTQYRGHQTSLGEILVNASASEELTGVTYFPIEGLSAVLQDWPELNDDFIPHYVEQVLLLASLASGGRSVCEQLVFHWVPCDVLPVMLESTRVPTIVHAAMVSLFAYCAGMFGPMLSIRQDIRSVRCIVTGTVASRPASASCPLVLDAAVPELVAARAYVLRYLQRTPLSGEEEVAAEYLATLHLTDVLVNGGVISVADYRELTGMLVGCLNRAKADRSTFLETPTVHACRMRTLQLVHSLMDVLLTWRALELVDFYRESAAPPAYSQLFQFTVGEILQRQKIVTGQPVRQPVLPMTNLCGAENIKDRPLVMLGSLHESLMSLAMETSSLRLRRVTVSLFFRLSNFTDELFRVANAVQLLTSEASLAFYSEINRTCATLEDVCTRSFLRPNTLAQTDAVLDALDGYLATAEYGSFVEKLGMMRHVGVPRQLLCLLQCLPLPLNDGARRIIFKVVALLQSMVQESLIREDLLKQVDLVSPLTPLGTNVISLLRTLYLQDTNTQLLLPLCVMSGVVKCLHTTHTSRAAIEFLTDLLGVTDCDERPLAHHQQSVWQAIVSDPRALRQVQFRHSWCGPKAVALRERILTSPDYYVGTGRLNQHLAICHLLHRVAVDNDLVRPEEIRSEVFGLNSIDVMMAVVTDPLLPTFFREPYVALVDSLLLMDAAILPEVFGSRSFIDFVRMSVMDLGRYLQLRGGVVFFADLGEDIERREDTVYRCLPSNTFERSLDDANFGLETYERHVFGPLLHCVRRVFMSFKDGVEHLNNRSRSQLKIRLNELVDMLCDLVHFVEGSVRCGKGKALLRSQTQILLDCFSVCQQHGFHGTARWRGDAFDALLQSLEEATSRSRTTSCCTVSSVELTDKSKKALPFVVTSEGEASSQLPSASTKAGSEQAMSALWMAYLTRHLAEGEYGREDNLQLVAAGILLRSCDRGTGFLYFLMCSISTLSVHNTTQLFRLVRQLVQLAPNNPLDDSVLLLYEHVTMESACLTIEMPLRSRQTLLSRWPGDTRQETPTPLLAVITELVDSPHASLRSAALRAATALVKGGHSGMQESYKTFCRHCADEQLFFTLRNHLTGFVEELRRYAQSLSRGHSPTAAAHLLPSMETTTLELLLVKLLCARQYTPLQTYLIAQPDNNISVNLIETMVDLVAMSSSAGNEVTTPFFMQLLSTVSETMQGPCRTNQECFVAYKAADYLTVLLADENTDSQGGALLHAREAVDPLATKKAPPNLQRESALRLQMAALSTLLALIEGRQDPAFIGRVLATVDLTVLGCSMDRSAALYERVHGPIERVHSRGIINGDFKNSVKAMKRFWREYWRGDHPTGREEIQDELALGVNVYIFFRACHDMEKLAYTQSVNDGGQFVDFVDKRGHTIQKVLRKTNSYLMIGGRVGKVEVIRDGSLERVYFRILSRSEDNLTKRTKDSIIQSVARTSDNERLQSFFRKSTEAIVEMNTYEGMRQRLVLFLTNYTVREMRLLAMGLILAVNLIMLIGIRAPQTPYVDGTPYGIRFTLYILGILIIAVQGVLVLQALTGPVVIRVTTGWERRRIRQEEQAKLKMQRESIPTEETWYEEEREASPIEHSRSIAYTAYLAVTTRDFFQHLFFMFVCIMGFVNHPIWASVQLLQVVLNSPVLDNLMKALSQRFMSLVLTLLSLLFMIFIFTMISYYFFSELFDPLGTRGNGFNCYTLSQCWLVHVDTIRGGGGVGGVAEWPTFYSKDSFGYWFSFFRLMYHLFINMLMLNLFLGVIVDSLGQLRRARELILADQRKKCFICGILRHTFDIVQAGTYERHTEEDHHMWHYVFFLHYLSEKDPSTFTGQEAYVDRLVQRRDITFYPIGRSIVLSSVGSGSDSPGQSNVSGSCGGVGGDEGGSAPLVAVDVAVRKSVLEPLLKKMEEMQEALAQLATTPAAVPAQSSTSMRPAALPTFVNEEESPAQKG